VCSTLLPLRQCVGLTGGTERAALRRNPAQWLLDLVAKEPDLTLEEIRDRLRREKKLAVATSSVWRFYDRHEITFKKSPARG
jgi:transposase